MKEKLIELIKESEKALWQAVELINDKEMDMMNPSAAFQDILVTWKHALKIKERLERDYYKL
jgi:hypothetical protein